MSVHSRAPVRVDIWADIACPWCTIGAARLDAAIEQYAKRRGAPEFEVRFHAFLLDPDAVRTPRTHAEDLAFRKGMTLEQVEQMFARIAELGAEEGLTFNFDDVQSASTRKGHELIAFAAERGLQRAAVDALQRAYFAEGRDVSDLDTLVEIGAGIGLHRHELRTALESGELETRVEIDFDEARRLGVTGVPFFVFDLKYAFSGAQPAEQIVKVIDHVVAERDEGARVN